MSALITVLFIIVVFAGGCTAPAESPAPSHPAGQQDTSPAPAGSFTIGVASLAPGSVLPDVYTCKGAGETPEIVWDGVPPGTKSLALVLDDPDAPNGRFTHWIVFNIPPDSRGIARAQPNAKVLTNGAQQGETSAGSRAYYPPCPPIGSQHRYVFRLYAVDMDITQPTADRDSIDWALTGHTLAETEFTTTVRR